MRTLSILIVCLGIGLLAGGCNSDTSSGEVKKITGEMKSDKSDQVPPDVNNETNKIMGPPNGKSGGRSGR